MGVHPVKPVRSLKTILKGILAGGGDTHEVVLQESARRYFVVASSGLRYLLLAFLFVSGILGCMSLPDEIVRTPRPKIVRTPRTKPDVGIFESAIGLDHEVEDPEESDLIRRLRRKVAGVPEIESPTIKSENNRRLSNLLLDNDFDVTEDQVDDCINNLDANDSDLDVILDQMLNASCALFAQEILTGPPEPPYSGRFLISDHHEEWDDLISKHDRVCVLAPRDHGKTFFYDFAYPIWKAQQQKNGCGFIFSATQDQATRILADIKSEIETNPKLQHLVPSKKDEWSSTKIKLSNGHRIYARGFGTRVRGAHPDWIVVDDGLTDETAYSETVRKKQIDYFLTAITNMIIPGGQIVVVGTPFHAADLYKVLEDNDEYEFKRYKALGSDGNALWPERYSKKRLERRKREIGSIRFTREFLCEPISDEMSLFPYYLFQGEQVERFNHVLGMPKNYWEKADVEIFMGVDFAMSSTVQADFTVVWTAGIDKFGNRWLIDIQREKGLAYQAQLSLINKVARKYEPALVYLEANQCQRIFGDELIRTTDLPIKQFVTGVQKHSLDKGVPSLRVLLENGKFRIPRGDKHSVEMTDIWIEEMHSFTWTDGELKSVAGHDDTVMACWICDQAIKHGGFKYSFGEDEDLPSAAELDKELLGDPETENQDVSAVPKEPGDNGNGNGGESQRECNLVDEDSMRLFSPTIISNGRFGGGW